MDQPDIASFKGRRVHMVGIGGSSMSGLAEMLLREGYLVTGSDSAESHTLDRLRSLGIPARAGHRPQDMEGAELLVYSAAISPEDPERREASRLKIPQLERAALLGQLMRGYARRACVCGTHGKTTVSAMLAQVLLDAGLDPTAHIGGKLDRLGGGSRIGGRDLFVAEACEFNRSFLRMAPTLAVVTNIEEDHLDCYGDMERVEEAYLAFLSLLPPDGAAIGWGADARVLRVFGKLPRRQLLFDLHGGADWTAGELSYSPTACASFKACLKGEALCGVSLGVAGDFNALHALAALAAAHELGADLQAAAASLNGFRGVRRRFEYTGTVSGMLLYHDYGHNPAEMRSALGVAKLQGRRVIAVMQPHTFSRVKSLFHDYLTCTGQADLTLVTEIYAAREKDPGDISSRMLVDGMRARGIDARLTPSFADAEACLLRHGRPGDLVLTMGCGDIDLLNEIMQRNWDARAAGGSGADTARGRGA